MVNKSCVDFQMLLIWYMRQEGIKALRGRT